MFLLKGVLIELNLLKTSDFFFFFFFCSAKRKVSYFIFRFKFFLFESVKGP